MIIVDEVVCGKIRFNECLFKLLMDLPLMQVGWRTNIYRIKEVLL